MADTLVEGAVYTSSWAGPTLWGPYWSDESTAVVIFTDTNIDLAFARTTDKGATWATTEIHDAGKDRTIACWYDKETPGNTGTLVHIAWLDAEAHVCYYRTLDVSDGSLGTQRTVDSTLTVVAAMQGNRIAITQTVSGNIILAFSTQSDRECYKSSDNFATAGTDIADVYEAGTPSDHALFFPAATADDNDACALFWDRDTDTISVKMYDDSVNSWTETVIASPMFASSTYQNMDGAVRHSDSHVLIAAHSKHDDAGDDLRTWDLTVDSIASPTVTAKTNIFTDQGESAQVSVFINQQNDDVRITHLKGGTWTSTVDVVYHLSTDGMGAWGVEQAYSESAADDFRLVHAGRTVGNDGGRYQPVFFNDDLDNLYVNETNDIEIAAVSVEEEEAGPVAAAFGIPLVIVPGRAVSY